MSSPEIDEWLKKVNEADGKRIRESSMFMGVVSKNFVDDPRCAFQIGLAILLNKPIGLLVVDGQEIPEPLRKIAAAIEVCDTDDKDGVQKAGQRLMDRLQNEAH